MSKNSRMRHKTVRTVTAAVAVGGLLLGSGTAAGAVDPFELLTGSLDAGSALLQGDEQAPQSRLATVPNFRDAAGDAGHGYRGDGGAHMRQGILFRSDNLAAISDDDAQAMSDLGIVTIYDLRSDEEVEAAPDRPVPGVERRHLPIDVGATEAEHFAHMNDPEEGREFMRELNRDFVTDAQALEQFGTMLAQIADTEGAVLYHCTAGKDRTGWISMLLQHIAGADDATIMQDYLLTNEYIADTVEPTLDRIEEAGLNPEIFRPMILVEESFLQAGLDEVAKVYGDLDTYLTDGLGLDTAQIETLKAKMLV